MYKVLYGLDKSGGYKIWEITVNDNMLKISFGKEGGKMQVKEELVYGKNIGKANETSDSQQADLESESRYKKQLDKGYRPTKEELEELPLLPMLAQDYHKQGHRIEYPCWVSPKLDGVRCLAYWEDGEIVLLSRGGKQYHVPHIQNELSQILPYDVIVDGEIYVHGFYLEEITSAVKKPNKLTPTLNYIGFDVVNGEVFQERLKELDKLTDKDKGLLSVSYEKCCDEQELKSKHDAYVRDGYEGIMLRNRNGRYESGKRSADLQKYKEFLDDEFEIVDVTEDRNGNAVFTVQNIFEDNTFHVTYGDFEQRKHFLTVKEELIGKYITVKYQTLYKDTSIPQFPTGKVIRDYE